MNAGLLLIRVVVGVPMVGHVTQNSSAGGAGLAETFGLVGGFVILAIRRPAVQAA
jgi:hypothetical protein